MNDDAATASWNPARSGRWLMRYPLEMLRAARERQLARRVIARCLAERERLLAQSPELFGRALYEAIVRRLTGLDAHGARRVVERAESSYACWPVERDLRFQDVVQYLAAERCMAGRPADEGVLVPLHLLVARRVPGDL